MKLSISSLSIKEFSDEQNRSIESRIADILESWEGTRYLAGCQVKKAGVDCVRFVSGVLDELHGTSTPIARLPQDASFHNKQLCQAALKSFLSRFDYEEIKNGQLQPGDVLIAGPIGGGPGHALIAGIDCLWHCNSKSVVRTGTVMVSGGAYFLKKIVRSLERDKWL
jgi:cell wall-associated NlpC family hydrolase